MAEQRGSHDTIDLKQGSSHVIDQSELTREIDDARVQLEGKRDDATVARLAKLLRHRFFALGDRADMDEYFALQETLPPINLAAYTPVVTTFRQELSSNERHWVKWQPWLLSMGYQLYHRHRPDWIPSWLGKDAPRKILHGDHNGPGLPHIIAAVRCDDNKPVFLKICKAPSSQRYPERPTELRSAIFFSSEPRRSDPRNHCCPLLDLFRAPNVGDLVNYIMVMPMLRDVTYPWPPTVGDVVDCISQFAEGVAFMHEHNFAHCDIHLGNAMMDASRLYPGGWNPWMVLWTYPDDLAQYGDPLPDGLSRLGAVKYYFVDFGVSVHFEPPVARRQVLGIAGLNLAPELSTTVPYDPFAVDIRQFGDMLHELDKNFGSIGFLRPLIAKARRDLPTKRPTAAELGTHLQGVIHAQSQYHLMSPVGVSPLRRWVAYVRHMLSVLLGGEAKAAQY